MKKVMLVFSIVFLISIFLSFNSVLAENFLTHCADDGCYIHAGDACGDIPGDIVYILGAYPGGTNCATTSVCNGDNILTTINSDPWPGGKPKHDHNDQCRDARKDQCVYDIPCGSGLTCDPATVTCVTKIQLNEAFFAERDGTEINTSRIGEEIILIVNGEEMVSIGSPLTYSIYRDGDLVNTFSRDASTETHDNYTWVEFITATNFIGGSYAFNVSVAGVEASSGPLTGSFTIPILNITKAYFADTSGTIIPGARLNETVNLKVEGSDLLGRNIIYQIYNRGVLSLTHNQVATLDYEDTFEWDVGNIGGGSVGGQFNFKATIEISGLERESENNIAVPELTDVYFTNLLDTPISETGLNSLVKLNISGLGLVGENITYEIWKEDGGFLFFDKKIFTASGDGLLKWRAGSDNNGTLLGGGTYYFIAKTDDAPAPTTGSVIKSVTGNAVIIEQRSLEDLEVSSIEINIPPVANITGPLDKQIYFINTPIFFSQDSYDADDPFTYVWELADGTIKEGNSSDLEDYSFTHEYIGESNLGQKNIKLTVTDDRGRSDTDRISILVINSTYLLTSIDFPESGSSYGRVVSYDARGTYAVSSETVMTGTGDDCTKEIICLAGNCPSETAGCPTTASLGCNYVGACPVPVQNSPQSHNNISFCWTFDGGDSGSFCQSGNAGAVFDKSFNFIGSHTSSLEASITI